MHSRALIDLHPADVAGVSRQIHLVYPHGDGIAAPHVIGRRLGEHLARRHNVVLHDWDALDVVAPRPGDILLGHPHPVPGTLFRRSFGRRGWSRRLVLSPFNGDVRQVAFLDPFVRRADAYLAITGKWWADHVGSTPMAHWAPHMVHLDLAIDPADFPFVKAEIAPPGRRRILYVGHSGWQKNVAYLSQIALACPQWEFGWIGSGNQGDIPGVVHHGMRDTSLRSTQDLVATYDFLLTVGRADANPMCVLEAMGWGLVPVCTPQSGYVDEPGVVNVPLDDARGAARVLEEWQNAPEERLRGAQRTNVTRLDTHFTWERFGRQVEEAFDVDHQQARPVGPAQRARLAATALSSQSGPLRGTGRRLAARVVRERLLSHRGR